MGFIGSGCIPENNTVGNSGIGFFTCSIIYKDTTARLTCMISGNRKVGKCNCRIIRAPGFNINSTAFIRCCISVECIVENRGTHRFYINRTAIFCRVIDKCIFSHYNRGFDQNRTAVSVVSVVSLKIIPLDGNNRSICCSGPNSSSTTGSVPVVDKIIIGYGCRVIGIDQCRFCRISFKVGVVQIEGCTIHRFSNCIGAITIINEITFEINRVVIEGRIGYFKIAFSLPGIEQSTTALRKTEGIVIEYRRFNGQFGICRHSIKTAFIIQETTVYSRGG